MSEENKMLVQRVKDLEEWRAASDAEAEESSDKAEPDYTLEVKKLNDRLVRLEEQVLGQRQD